MSCNCDIMSDLCSMAYQWYHPFHGSLSLRLSVNVSLSVSLTINRELSTPIICLCFALLPSMFRNLESWNRVFLPTTFLPAKILAREVQPRPPPCLWDVDKRLLSLRLFQENDSIFPFRNWQHCIVLCRLIVLLCHSAYFLTSNYCNRDQKE